MNIENTVVSLDEILEVFLVFVKIDKVVNHGDG